MNELKFHHVCIQTNDYETSKDFYMNILNFQLVDETKNFHGREYNSWLKLNDFYIELQTGKGELIRFDSNTESLAHFCLYTNDLSLVLKNILDKGYNNFKRKNNDIIYKVLNGSLFKIVAPEGTIIEIRDNAEI